MPPSLWFEIIGIIVTIYGSHASSHIDSGKF